MKRKIIITIAILLSLATLAGIYLGYDWLTQKRSQPIEAIPVDASALLEVNGPAYLWERLHSESQVWASLRTTDLFSRLTTLIGAIDTSLKSDQSLKEAFESKQLIISLHPISDTSADFLFVMQLPQPLTRSTVDKFIKKHSMSVPSKDSRYHAILFKGAAEPFYYTIQNSLFIGSYDYNLIQKSYNQLKSGHSLMQDPIFARVHETAGRNVDAHLYVQFSSLPQVLSHYSARDFLPGFDKLKRFARWAGLDISVKKDEVMLSGFTMPMNSDFLHLFKSQEPGESHTVAMLPASTASYASFSFSDFTPFADQYNNYLSATAEKGNETSLLDASTIQNLKDADLSELTVALITGTEQEATANSLVLLTSKNASQLKAMLDESIPSALQINTVNINGHELRKIDFHRFFGNFMYNMIPDISEAYYYQLDDVFVFSPSPFTLQNAIMDYLKGETLLNSQDFKSLSENIQTIASISLYYNPWRSKMFHHFFLDDPTANDFDQSLATLKSIEGVSLQFSSDQELCFTSVLIRGKQAEDSIKAGMPSLADSDSINEPVRTSEDTVVTGQNDVPIVWSTKIGSGVTGKPYLLPSHALPDKMALLVHDKKNRVSLVDLYGKLHWQVAFDDPIVGKIEAVDYLKNGKIQYLVSTSKSIHLIDAKGREVKPFPISYPVSTNIGASVVKLKGQEYRIVVPLTNLKIVAYNREGRPDKTWAEPVVEKRVNSEPILLEKNGKEYLIFPLEKGNVLITDKNGKRIMNISKSFTNASKSAFYINETNNKGMMLTTDSDGKLVYIPSSGPVTKTAFNSFSNDHIFLYEDTDGNGDPDFLYVDGKQLYIYDRMKNVVMQHHFSQKISDAPQLIKQKGKSTIIGVFSRKSSEIYLLPVKGDGDDQVVLKGSTPFVVTKPTTSRGSLLISGDGETLRAYEIPF